MFVRVACCLDLIDSFCCFKFFQFLLYFITRNINGMAKHIKEITISKLSINKTDLHKKFTAGILVQCIKNQVLSELQMSNLRVRLLYFQVNLMMISK